MASFLSVQGLLLRSLSEVSFFSRPSTSRMDAWAHYTYAKQVSTNPQIVFSAVLHGFISFLRLVFSSFHNSSVLGSHTGRHFLIFRAFDMPTVTIFTFHGLPINSFYMNVIDPFDPQAFRPFHYEPYMLTK